MSYDISMVDANTKEVLKLRNPQYLIGGTYRVEVSPETGELVPAKESEASFNITYNYAPYYYAATEGDSRFAHDDGDGNTSYGIRGLYGRTGMESIPMLHDMIRRIEISHKDKDGHWLQSRRKRERYFDVNGNEIDYVQAVLRGKAATKEEEEYVVSEGDVKDYWEPTAANAISALYTLLHIAVELPDGIWDGD